MEKYNERIEEISANHAIDTDSNVGEVGSIGDDAVTCPHCGGCSLNGEPVSEEPIDEGTAIFHVGGEIEIHIPIAILKSALEDEAVESPLQGMVGGVAEAESPCADDPYSAEEEKENKSDGSE